MSRTPSAVTLEILGKEYKIACEPEEQDGLIESARQLDRKMRQIRDSGKVSGADRIAVMAALNMAHELHLAESRNRELELHLADSLIKMSNKIENVLEITETR
ncbi:MULTISPECIES: cell division protein ZapA [Methylotuvimicrobium]|jgi:cell division protein ZapA|uniref:Cell division protein ZapA n=1 Tax=Methylotuvimicrobium alcaliphilum (strain DSM 19304 / NCIMB 14124 / VKM B-2133 / 20Z) TaxID=1091494 RepID=G4T4F4_META2|nr:cell division protein ZapA [Methylotuvimicrobium alcaliphilum]MBU2569408.1 cell division protein ZapA [Gammaproteobacteria bacterium]CCE24965.1 conserved protein of unknown function [Methylotuvimicrobium alcaliphilum 20Z]